MVLDGITQFSDLPSRLVMDILSRLPITTLVTCRCVCKDWIRLFQDPYFIKLQLAASPMHILNRVIAKEGGIVKFGQFMEDNRDDDLELKVLELPTKVDLVTLLNLRPRPERHGLLMLCVNSCNGLLCLVDHEYIDGPMPLARSVCVCNPILGEWVAISTPVRNYSFLSRNIPLVFSAKNNQHKLLHGFRTVGGGYGYEMYTLGGTRRWRRIHETLGCRPGYEHDSSTLLHGSLHWINDHEKQEFICCFDVDNEKFRRLSLPGREGPRLGLGVINGCLCALFYWGSRNNDTHPMEIWSMKEYGVEKSWAMMHTVTAEISVRSLLFSLNEEEFLIYDLSDRLISYNLKTKRCRQERLLCLTSDMYFHIPYKPSFISLKDVARGEEEVILTQGRCKWRRSQPFGIVSSCFHVLTCFITSKLLFHCPPRK